MNSETYATASGNEVNNGVVVGLGSVFASMTPPPKQRSSESRNSERVRATPTPETKMYQKTLVKGSKEYQMAVQKGVSMTQLKEHQRRTGEVATRQHLQQLPMALAAAVLRKDGTTQWRDGVPARFTDYAAMYEIFMLVNEKGFLTMPMTNVTYGTDPCVTAMTAWPQIRPKRAEMIDAVVLPNSAARGTLMFMPVDRNFESGDNSHVDTTQWTNAYWLPLYVVLGALRPFSKSNYKISSGVRNLLATLQEWLHFTHARPESIVTLWLTSPTHRIQHTVTNPQFNKDEHLNEAEHPLKVIHNPLFNSDLVMFKEGTNFLDERAGLADDYDAREDLTRATKNHENMVNKGGSKVAMHSTGKPRLSWDEEFPMHKAALIGDASRVRELMKAGGKPAAQDVDSWTPLHYACWYGHATVVRALIYDWLGSPTTKTDNGSTALHFACRNGHAEIVTILLACPIVNPTIKDKEGCSPLNLCEKFQQGNWKDVQKILKDPDAINAVNRFSNLDAFDPQNARKFRIYLLDSTEKVIRLPDGDTTTAQELRDGIAGMVHIPDECKKMFAIWITSPSLSIQLDDKMLPLKRMKRWPQMLELYADEKGSAEEPFLVFRRNQNLSLAEERKIRSPAALKFLYDEALVNFLQSFWPCEQEHAIYLAGLLMQIHYGDHDEKVHKPGFITTGGLNTMIPTHLLHNQLKSSVWEKRIYQSHKNHSKTTDIHLLHRLFLQYCWQWPFYGATFYGAVLVRNQRRITNTRADFVRLGINSDWLTIVHAETNILKASLSMDAIQPPTVDENTITIESTDPTAMAELQHYMKGPPLDKVQLISRQSFFFGLNAKAFMKERERQELDRQRQRVAQGGPKILGRRVEGNTKPVDDLQAKVAHATRMEEEKKLRYKLMFSFGEDLQKGISGAHQLFISRPSCVDGVVPILELKAVFAELGYWLGTELEGARLVMAASNKSTFGFRDVVSWWSQSQRSWLFLLDELGFKQRQMAANIFLRNDPNRTGKLVGERLKNLITGLRSTNMTKVTEAACLTGLDPTKSDVVHFNDYIDWLCQMHIISDRKPMEDQNINF
eukprot:m.48227 g.48227  ORF g.48227 m.48227 type:complete len:1069 (+) comp20693_c0_seq1:312-3518(+)